MKISVSSKVVREAINKHILSCVYDYQENEFTTLKEACNHLNNEFERVSNHAYNIHRFPNAVSRFVDYLQGIPFHFEFEDYKIQQFLNELGINPSDKEYSSTKMWNLYGLLIYRQMIKNL